MLEGSGGQIAGVLAITKVAALAYLMFNLYSPPCFAAIGAMNSEMKRAKWLWGGTQKTNSFLIPFFCFPIYKSTQSSGCVLL